MCGIFFSLSQRESIYPDDSTKCLLKHRGPDSDGLREVSVQRDGAPNIHATFYSTVLSLRGTSVVDQPLYSTETNSVLCWNGEAWSIQGDVVQGNDSQKVFDALLAACALPREDEREQSLSKAIDALSSIRGPFALVFYDAQNGYIYYGRDCLGRRSLLQKSTPEGCMTISSVCDNAGGEGWSEVEADGIYVVDLLAKSLQPKHIPHRRSDEPSTASLSFVGKSQASLIPANERSWFPSRRSTEPFQIVVRSSILHTYAQWKPASADLSSSGSSMSENPWSHPQHL